MLQTSLLLIKCLNKTETPIFYLKCVHCLQRQSQFLSVMFSLFTKAIEMFFYFYLIMLRIIQICAIFEGTSFA